MQLAVLTGAGWAKVVATAPGHAGEVQQRVFDQLDATQLRQLDKICDSLLDGMS